MLLKNILQPSQVIYNSEINSKKQVLQQISNIFSEQAPWLKNKDIFNSLLERERIGSTAVGHGIAIPHCRLQDISKPVGTLLVLKNNIDFNSVDNQPVNIIFALMMPEKNHKLHLQLLGRIAEVLNQESIRTEISKIQDSSELFDIINKY